VQQIVTHVQNAALVTAQQRELTLKVAQLQSECAKQASLLALQSDALAALQRRQPLDNNLANELYDADDLNVRLVGSTAVFECPISLISSLPWF
jgi:hypothetical protein